MGNFVNKLEKKFGKFAISRLPLIMVVCYAVGYLMQIINPNIIHTISLNPYAIIHGQVWRLVTWVLIPPDSLSIFVLLTLYIEYMIANSLERVWGTFYFNYYIFVGLIFTIIASFIIFGVMYAISPAAFVDDVSWQFGYCSNFAYISMRYFTTYYISMSLFLAFATMWQDVQFLLFFLIPVKVKYLGIFYVVFMAIDVVNEYVVFGGLRATMMLFVIVASMLNFIQFYIIYKGGGRRTATQARAAKEYKKKTEYAKMQAAKISKHKCAICGRTNDTHPNLEFRFCSKCVGNYEYCQDHLFTHVHKGDQ